MRLAFLDVPVRMRPLAILRIPVGLIAAWQLWPVFTDALDGRTYHDVFHRPYLAWLPDLPPAWFTAVIGIGVVAALLMSVGLATRVTTAMTFVVFAYVLLLSATNFHHNRGYLTIVLFGLAAAPCGREWSLDALLRRWRGLPPLPLEAPAWPLWFLRVECSVVYGASGLSKLIDRDWFGGVVTWLRVVHQEARVRASILPDWVVDVLVDRDAHRLFAPGIVLTELFIAVGLWFGRTRPWALALAILFHVLIELSSSVETFSFLAIAVLLCLYGPAVAPYLRRRVERHG